MECLQSRKFERLETIKARATLSLVDRKKIDSVV